MKVSRPPMVPGLTVELYKLSVRRRLKDAGISFREVCDELDTHHTKLSTWLRADKDLYLSTVLRLEAAINAMIARKAEQYEAKQP